MSRHQRRRSRVPAAASVLAGMALLTASWAGFAAEPNESAQAQAQPQTTLSLLPIVAPQTSAKPKTPKSPASPASPARETSVTTKPMPKVESTPDAAPVYFADCDAARAAGAAPIRDGEPGYRSALDRDGEGIACATAVRTQETAKPAPEAEGDAPAPVVPEVQQPVPADAPTSGGVPAGTPQVCTFAGRLLGDPDMVCSALAPLPQD